MTALERAKQVRGHVYDDWRDALIDEKIKPLVCVLNNPRLGLRTAVRGILPVATARS